MTRKPKFIILLFILILFVFTGLFLVDSLTKENNFFHFTKEFIFKGGNELLENKNKLIELVFVEDAQNDEVIVLNLEGEIIKRIKVGKEPHDIAVSADQKFIATANVGDGTVSIIYTQTLSLERTISTGRGAHGVVFSPDGKFLFVANSEEDTLSIIYADSFDSSVGNSRNRSISKIPVGDFPEYVGVTSDGSKIFTTNLGGNGSISIIENNGFEFEPNIKTIGLGIDPHGWAVPPDGSKIIITNLGSNFTYFLDAETFEEISYIDTGSTTEFAAFKNDTELWVTDIGAHYISIIDVEKNEVLEQIRVGETPHGISFSQDKTLVFVPLYGPGEVVIIDVSKREIIKKIKIGDELHNSVVVQINEN